MKNKVASGCGCLFLLLLGFGGCVAMLGSGGSDAVTQDEPGEPLSAAEQYKESVVFYTNGIVAKEAVGFIPAEMMLEGQAGLCGALAQATVDSVEATLADSFRKTGHDEKAAENMAAGFVQATTQPGVCEYFNP